MGLYDPDGWKSDYIFDQSETLFYVGIILSAALISFSLYQFFKVYKGDKYFLKGDDKKENRLPISVVALALGIGILIGSLNDTSRFRRIRKYRAYAVGTTIELNGLKNPTVKYKFEVNGKVYYNECGFTYDGEIIHGIKTTGGHYKVIYNSKDRGESVMDFKIDEDHPKDDY